MSTATTIASGLRSAPLRLLGDERLAALAAEGDRQAFGLIYERFERPLLTYCRSIVHDDEDARDALQSTFVNALPGLAGRRVGVPLKAWLYRIAHNESISLLRRRRPHKELGEGLALARAPELDAGERERLQQLVADLNQLPDRQRGALVMRELSGLSYDDIGTALGVSAGAARQIVFEARASLTEYAGGREAACSTIRRSISDGDRRALRARRVRAHLRGCQGCREFEHALTRRRRDFALLFPALPALLAGLVKPLAGKAGGGFVAGLTGGGAAASPALKGLAVGAAVVVAGAGSVDLAEHAVHRPVERARGGQTIVAAVPRASAPLRVQARVARRSTPRATHVNAPLLARTARPAVLREAAQPPSHRPSSVAPAPHQVPAQVVTTQPASQPPPTAPAVPAPSSGYHQPSTTTWQSMTQAVMASAQQLTQQALSTAAQLTTSYTQSATSPWSSMLRNWFQRSTP